MWWNAYCKVVFRDMLLVAAWCYTFLHRCACSSLLLATQIPSGIRLSRELRAQSFAGKTRPPEEFSTRLLLRIPSTRIKQKNTTWSGVFCFMVHLQGFEPGTHWLRVSCSTNWAKGALFFATVELYHIIICLSTLFWKKFIFFYNIFLLLTKTFLRYII